MSVIVLDLSSEGRYTSLNDVDTIREHFGTTIMALFSLIGVSKQGYETGEPSLVPMPIVKSFATDPKGWRLGRHGIETATCSWVREKYPNARFEITITLVSLRNFDVTHQFILYIK